jgi:glyoxylase-like metal-dependent hydrolase (beta-lactamase superfamily II)
MKFLAAGSGCAGLSAVLPFTAFAQTGNAGELQTLSSSLALVTGNGGNILVKKAASNELLIVDGGMAEHARNLRRLIESSMDSRRITTLINTHWHPEQTGLNRELGNRNTRIFAHENTRQWLGTSVKRLWEDYTIDPLPESARPNEGFYHYGDLVHGNDRIEYGYLRQSHTDGDMYVFLPQDNVLHTGGTVSTDEWPFLDWWTGGWMGGIADGIDTLLDIANDDTVIVPASGPVINKVQLAEMRDMYSDIYNTVRRLFTAASTPEETVAAKPAANWEDRYGNADEFINLAHWSLIAHLSPDA